MRQDGTDKLSFDSLSVFTVAARHENFSAAARELGVTQAAISRRISALEEALGFVLFERVQKRVVLTTRGRFLYRRVTASLDSLSDSIIQLTEADPVENIVVLAPTSITYFWLEPRLRSFTQAFPEYLVRLQDTDDLYHTAASDDTIAVLAGDGQHPHWSLRPLFGEELVPVAAPRYLESIGLQGRRQDIPAAEIAKLDLIGYGRLNRLWYTLEDWLESRGVSRDDVRFPVLHAVYPTAVNAALRGEGVVLGSRTLLSHLLETGELVEVSNHVKVTNLAYYIGTPKSGRIMPAAQRLASWLVEQARSRDSG